MLFTDNYFRLVYSFDFYRVIYSAMFSKSIFWSTFIFCSLILLTGNFLFGSCRNFQTDTAAQKIKTNLLYEYKNYPQERVFVHINQPAFSNGETIWYKVYTMSFGKPSVLSKIIYVQLTDTAGHIISHNKLPVAGGKAHGNIEIESKIKTGWYKLTAFTSWMMNFGEGSYYQQKIYIRNLSDSVTKPIRNDSTPKKYSIKFFPEGGDIIDGSIAKVAFRAFDNDGLGVKIVGTITENRQKKITDFTSVHDGMGEFEIEALADNTYDANIKFPDGSIQEIALPKAKKSGIELHVNQGLNTISIKLAYAGDSISGGVLVATQNSGQIVTIPLHLSKGINVFELPKTTFTTGVLRLTAYDSDGLPRAERMVFVNNHDISNPELVTDTLSLNKNIFTVKLKYKSGAPVKGDFSISITDSESFQENAEQNIYSALLLSPEIKGDIHDPKYYFRNQNDSLANQLDLVMLTNGWRHFVITNNRLTHPVEQSQYIAGKVAVNRKNHVSKIKILIANSDSTKFIGYISPDTTGRFILNDFNHSGLSNIYIENTQVKDMPAKIFSTLDDSLVKGKAKPFQPYGQYLVSDHYLNPATYSEKYKGTGNDIILNTVNIKATKASETQKLLQQYVSPKYNSGNGYTLNLVSNPPFNINIIDYMRGRFPGLQIVGDDPNLEFIYHSVSTLQRYPYFYLNENEVPYSRVKDLIMTNIALIRFIPAPIDFAPGNGGKVGAIMIYMKKGSDEIKKTNALAGFDHFIFNGFSVTREFGTPNYKNNFSGVTDNGTTLFWSHDLQSDNKGCLKVDFPNSNKVKKFRIILQGMDDLGNLVYFEKRIQQ